ncbi:hypothetical protein KKA15_05495 [Patescibacteria group bacterium]|nr:hypothetical protein [Patescibacteria group bacterium]
MSKDKTNKYIKIAIIIIVIIVVVTIGYLIYDRLNSKQIINENNQNVLNNVDTDNDQLSDSEEIKLGTNPEKIDTDLDRLTDFEEVKTYKTDPLKHDSDGDRLNDYDEVKILKTDPLNTDTDGDGILDGQEIISHSNPLGEGKLEGNPLNLPIQQ